MIFATVKRNAFRRNSFRNTSVGNLDIISLSTVDQGWLGLVSLSGPWTQRSSIGTSLILDITSSPCWLIPAELEFGLTRDLLTTSLPQDQPVPPGGFEIDSMIDVEATFNIQVSYYFTKF